MIEEAQQIFDYLPVSFRNESEQEYITFLWETFVANYEAKKYSFAFLAYHMIFMSFVYFEIWQIKQNRVEDFKNAMVGFAKQDEKELMDASTPFMLWRVKERTVFRFLKLIGVSNSDIGLFETVVKERDNIAHSNGVIHSGTQKDVDRRIEDILRYTERIQNHSTKIILNCYENFLITSAAIEELGSFDQETQIREVLVYGNYLSMKDIEVLRGYDHEKLKDKENYPNIAALVEKLQEMYPSEE